METEKLNLPQAFLERMKMELGEKFGLYEKAINESAVRGIRINTKKISVEKFCETFDEKLRKLSFCEDGFILLSSAKTGNMKESLAGLFYAQEPSSMLPVCASGIEKEKRPLKVLDLCASPGGKSGQIACRISDNSILFSNEIISSRAEVLYSNIERQGFKNVVVLNEKPENLGDFEGYFDYVFVDAPCSGEGMFRKNPETIAEWSEENVVLCANRQKEILSAAQKLVAPHGKLVYSTCTFSAAEDEEVVDWFLENHGFKLLDVDERIKEVTCKAATKPNSQGCAVKCFPFNEIGEGQFVAVFENLNEQTCHRLHTKKHYNSVFDVGSVERKVLEKFVNDNFDEPHAKAFLQDCKGRLFKFKENLYLAPIGFDKELQTALDELKFLSVGVRLGKVQKDRFEPNHAMFMNFGECFKLKAQLSETGMKDYIHGEELKTDLKGKGYAAVTVSGYAIGGAKLVDEKLKNLYPKGLRI